MPVRPSSIRPLWSGEEATVTTVPSHPNSVPKRLRAERFGGHNRHQPDRRGPGDTDYDHHSTSIEACGH